MQRQIEPLWGYSFYYPDDWSFQRISGVDTFTPSGGEDRSASLAIDRGYLLVQPEWNAMLKPVQPLWQTHIGRVAPMIGAKNLGTASWEMAGTQGLETVIILPKSKEERLWVGMLPFGHIVLKFVVSHPIEDRSWFEPQASDIIKSLHFLSTVPHVKQTEEGIPLPPKTNHIDLSQAAIEISEPSLWKGFTVGEAMGAVQAFYLREPSASGWSLEEFVPYPNDSGLGIARFRLWREDQTVGVGLIPVSSQAGSSLTQILIKHQSIGEKM